MAFAFSDRNVAERLKDMAGESQPGDVPQQGAVVLPNIHGNSWIFKTDGSGVSARSGTTVGKGDAVPYLINASDVLTELTANGTSITVEIYNLSEESVAANTWVQCKVVGNKPIVDVEYCDQV